MKEERKWVNGKEKIEQKRGKGREREKGRGVEEDGEGYIGGKDREEG